MSTSYRQHPELRHRPAERPCEGCGHNVSLYRWELCGLAVCFACETKSDRPNRCNHGILTEAKRVQVVPLREAGWTVFEIAERMGCHPSTIKTALRTVGYVAPDGRVTDADKARIVDLYAHGMTKAEIAIELGFHVGTVRKHAREMGLGATGPCRGPGIKYGKAVSGAKGGEA